MENSGFWLEFWLKLLEKYHVIHENHSYVIGVGIFLTLIMPRIVRIFVVDLF